MDNSTNNNDGYNSQGIKRALDDMTVVTTIEVNNSDRPVIL